MASGNWVTVGYRFPPIRRWRCAFGGDVKTTTELKDRITPHVNFFQKITKERWSRRKGEGKKGGLSILGECVRVCVCVWNIWIDVKLPMSELTFREIQNTSAGGMERTYEAPSNEAPHMILGYHWGRSVTYLQLSNFPSNGNPAKPTTGHSFFDFVYVCRNLHYEFILLVWASVHFRIQGYTTNGLFSDLVHYSTFHTFILGIPKITSKRTL